MLGASPLFSFFLLVISFFNYKTETSYVSSQPICHYRPPAARRGDSTESMVNAVTPPDRRSRTGEAIACMRRTLSCLSRSRKEPLRSRNSGSCPLSIPVDTICTTTGKPKGEASSRSANDSPFSTSFARCSIFLSAASLPITAAERRIARGRGIPPCTR